MSDRSDASSEGEGEAIRPHGDKNAAHDSSEEEDDDDEDEARRIADGFIVNEDDDDDDEEEEEEGKEERRKRRRKERKRKRRERERQRREEEGLSEDDLDLLNENAGYGGPSRPPLKRLRRRSGSDDERGSNRLEHMFDDEEDRGRYDSDDLDDFIEDDEEEDVARNETEEQRRHRKREEKRARLAQARHRPELAGVDKDSWNDIYDVFGDGHDYDWALDGEEGIEYEEEFEQPKKDYRLEDVFDPAEIKSRRLQDEDRAIAQADKPERHQLVNSTLSDNPILASDDLYPPPLHAAGWAFNQISKRTQYLFCGQHPEGSWPEPSYDYNQEPAHRRDDLSSEFIKVVSTALSMMFVQHLEIPHLWHYKRDAFSMLENSGQSSVQFLERDELWTLYDLGIKFRAIWQRCEQVKLLWSKIQKRRDVQDDYLTNTLLASVCNLSVEAASEGLDWLSYHYAADLRAIKEEQAIEDGQKRLPERNSAEMLRSGPIMKLVEAFGIDIPRVAVTFNDPSGEPLPPVTPDRSPADLAAEYSGTTFRTPADAIAAAQKILVSDFARDPTIRQQSRDFVHACGLVTVTPTDRGMSVIDEYHAYYTFKFLTDKPVEAFKETPQFLHILKAEEEGLITITVTVAEEPLAEFTSTLKRCVTTRDYGEIAMEWNGLREEAIDTVIQNHYIPAATRWVKENLRTQCEEFIAERARMELEFRINVRPYGKNGETPQVLAITTGQGNVQDAVMSVLLDDEGNIRATYKFDNLRDAESRAAFLELVEKRRPDVIVIGGLSVHTGKLRDDARGALRQLAIQETGRHAPLSENYSSHDEFMEAQQDFDAHLQPHIRPLVFVNDATARLYMNSEEAAKEHPELPINGRFALGLARYAQNPLNEYCRLGRQVVSVTYVEHHQKLVPEERLLVQLERGLVNAVCFIGIEVNSCVSKAYSRTMLPFVAGLGPRKADQLHNAISKLGGTLTNRVQLSELGTFGPTVFENVAGFLMIDNDIKDFMLDTDSTPEDPEPLDMTRIHPEDYEFAQKMCQDALDLDAEDVADQHKSAVVVQLMQDEDRARKLSELNLDDFAFNLQRQGEGNKRHTLGAIVQELILWRADRRPQFYIPTDWEILTMLTGETVRTVGQGLRITATVRKPLSGRVFCTLESGLEALLEREYTSDDDMIRSCEDVFHRGQAIKAVIIEPEPARFQVRISTRESDLRQSVPFIQPFRDEPFNNIDRKNAAEDIAAKKRLRKAGSIKRVVNHPNWHVMNSGQAEQFLAGMQRGDVVIRPSSKGGDHLAVTWKVDEDVYQHIDVQEIDKPNEYALGRILRVSGKYTYTDLDDLIINHVKAISRKFDEMQAHDKYRPEAELETYLKNYVQAHPGRSMYGFSLDSAHPGWLRVCFLNRATKDGGQIQTWPVKVLPGAYQLNNAEVPGVTELCNAFKAQYSTRLSEQGTGGRTPGIRMPARTPIAGGGGRTPGGRTPADPRLRGGTTPMYGAGGRTPSRGGYGGGGGYQGGGGGGGYQGGGGGGGGGGYGQQGGQGGYGQQGGGYQGGGGQGYQQGGGGGYGDMPPPPQGYGGPPGGRINNGNNGGGGGGRY